MPACEDPAEGRASPPAGMTRGPMGAMGGRAMATRLSRARARRNPCGPTPRRTRGRTRFCRRIVTHGAQGSPGEG